MVSQAFNDAADAVKNLTKKPSNDELLQVRYNNNKHCSLVLIAAI